MKILLMLFLFATLASCGKPDAKNLEEKAQRELKVETDNTNKKALQLEADLSRKQLFFSALEGTFEGSFISEGKEFKTRITLIPSLPPYTANRIRTLDEITADLNNLNFSFQVRHWSLNGTGVPFGCIFNQIKPDYDNGQVVAVSGNCLNVYKVSMYESNDVEHLEVPLTPSDILIKSQVITNKVLNGQIEKINEIHVEIQPTLVAKTFITILKRAQ